VIVYKNRAQSRRGKTQTEARKDGQLRGQERHYQEQGTRAVKQGGGAADRRRPEDGGEILEGVLNAAYDFKELTDPQYYLGIAIYMAIVMVSFVLSYCLTIFIYRRKEC